MPKITFWLNKKECDKLDEKVKEKDYPSRYAYVKDLVLKEIKEP